MVQDAKQVAINPADGNAVSRWRESNKAVSIWRYLFKLLLNRLTNMNKSIAI